MKKNVGSIDRVMRIIIAILIAVLYFTNVINGTLGIVLLIVGGILLVTSLFSLCPIYLMLGIKTCPAKK